MAERGRDLAGVAPRAAGWHVCRRSPGTPAWTDDFSNLFSVLDLDG